MTRAPPEAAAEARQDLLREPVPQPARPGVSARTAIQLFAAFVLAFGILLAQGAVVALAVCERNAHAALAASFGELWKTAFFASAIFVVGLVCLVVPGVVCAVGFSLAMPAALFERLPAAAALSRSWRLSRRAWPELLALVVLPNAAIVAVQVALAHAGIAPGPLAGAAVHAAVAVVLLPFPLALSGFVYLRARSEADRVPLAEVRQYIRRISAPG